MDHYIHSGFYMKYQQHYKMQTFCKQKRITNETGPIVEWCASGSYIGDNSDLRLMRFQFDNFHCFMFDVRTSLSEYNVLFIKKREPSEQISIRKVFFNSMNEWEGSNINLMFDQTRMIKSWTKQTEKESTLLLLFTNTTTTVCGGNRWFWFEGS